MKSPYVVFKVIIVEQYLTNRKENGNHIGMDNNIILYNITYNAIKITLTLLSLCTIDDYHYV